MPIIDAFPEPTPALSTASQVDFTFDILPDNLVDMMRELWLPRLKVNGVEVQIRDGVSLSEDENSIGETLNVTLLKVTDKGLFTPTASVDFGIGRRIGGAWDEATFIPLLTDASVQSVDYTIEGPPNNPTDRVSVTIISKTADKLNRTAETGLIIYDSNRTTVSDTDIETIYDAQGNAYRPEIMAIPGLKLSRLFQEIFIERCGFDTYHTNLPVNDYPVQYYEVGMGERFYDGLKGFMGMYRPAVRPIGDEIWINDTTLPQPAGWPAPRGITVDRPTSINLNRQPQKLDALMVQFVGLENNYDFTTFKYEYPTETNGEEITEIERITVQFRKITGPGTNIIVREALDIENRRTFLDGVEIDNTSETYEFTANGLPAFWQKTARKRLPPTEDVTLEPRLQNCLTEKEGYFYQAHPFKARTEFCSRRSLKAEGLVVIDSENTRPDGSDYIRDIINAQRNANIIEGQTFSWRTTRTREETALPLRNGNVSIHLREVDTITPLVLTDDRSERPGDVGISSVSSSRQTMPVFAADNQARSLDRTDVFPIGELPLAYGLPLARRVLIQRQTSSGTVSMTHIGYDAALQKGVPIAPADRNNVSLGNFLIVGRRIDISLTTGLIMTLTCREIAGAEVVFEDLPAYERTINEGQALIFPLPINCIDGFTLSLSPTLVSDLSIEARHVEDPPAPWTNLEAGSLDLSPWDGSVENFEIRVTAGDVSVITRRDFSLIVSEP